ncbi:hypothetical protein DFP72DRAFT_843487 [Ephemerocybe angulata]|uniref:Uncharacterized protein n=1 Tax=Ephemerocybe angulata TaxID=980116 RepID=A0A8H6IA63_9AGAR|nr:hypothetical protein DFP72DRAFT_843487 [Tulosesus angulatus]
MVLDLIGRSQPQRVRAQEPEWNSRRGSRDGGAGNWSGSSGPSTPLCAVMQLPWADSASAQKFRIEDVAPSLARCLASGTVKSSVVGKEASGLAVPAIEVRVQVQPLDSVYNTSLVDRGVDEDSVLRKRRIFARVASIEEWLIWDVIVKWNFNLLDTSDLTHMLPSMSDMTHFEIERPRLRPTHSSITLWLSRVPGPSLNTRGLSQPPDVDTQSNPQISDSHLLPLLPPVQVEERPVATLKRFAATAVCATPTHTSPSAPTIETPAPSALHSGDDHVASPALASDEPDSTLPMPSASHATSSAAPILLLPQLQEQARPVPSAPANDRTTSDELMMKFIKMGKSYADYVLATRTTPPSTETIIATPAPSSQEGEHVASPSSALASEMSLATRPTPTALAAGPAAAPALPQGAPQKPPPTATSVATLALFNTCSQQQPPTLTSAPIKAPTAHPQPAAPASPAAGASSIPNKAPTKDPQPAVPASTTPTPSSVSGGTPASPASPAALSSSIPNKDANSTTQPSSSETNLVRPIDDPLTPPAWYTAALGDLRDSTLGGKWAKLEESLGYGRMSKGTMPVKGRPEEWTKWTNRSAHGARNHSRPPFIDDPADIGLSIMKWWLAMQPSFRSSPGPLPSLIWEDPAGIGDAWAPLRKSGPNGTLPLLMLMLWWGRAAAPGPDNFREDSRDSWKALVADVSVCFDVLSATKVSQVQKRGLDSTQENDPNGSKNLITVSSTPEPVEDEMLSASSGHFCTLDLRIDIGRLYIRFGHTPIEILDRHLYIFWFDAAIHRSDSLELNKAKTGAEVKSVDSNDTDDIYMTKYTSPNLWTKLYGILGEASARSHADDPNVHGLLDISVVQGWVHGRLDLSVVQGWVHGLVDRGALVPMESEGCALCIPLPDNGFSRALTSQEECNPPRPQCSRLSLQFSFDSRAV